jgi:hypothetical protein
MLDRKKLAAPLFAQAAAFVAVLVIGGFTGHASSPAPTTTPTPVHAKTPVHATTPGVGVSISGTPANTKGPSVKLIVRAVQEGTSPLSASGSQVEVLQVRAGTPSTVASGTLNSALEYTTNVPAGQYQVCIDPTGWDSVGRTTHVLPGFDCSPADTTKGPQLVTFHLTPQTPQQVG